MKAEQAYAEFMEYPAHIRFLIALGAFCVVGFLLSLFAPPEPPAYYLAPVREPERMRPCAGCRERRTTSKLNPVAIENLSSEINE